MNKTEMIAAVAAKAGMTKVDAKKAVDAFLTVTEEQLKAGEKVAFPGFGTFSVKERPSRTGINPLTKKAITIKAKKVAKFKPGSNLDF